MVVPQKKVAGKKSPRKPQIIEYKQGDVLFHEKDKAEALYIIKEGQLRLYRPKGKGFIEIAVLRKGEVIGEMAFFDEKQTRRSCSASALVTTKVIEIGFESFGKAIKNLNPWFKTIIFTLADRLRDSNDLVKQLESNSVGYGGGKTSQYKFFNNADLVKLLDYFYLVFKGYGVQDTNGYVLHKSILKYHLLDIFNFPEVKMEEFVRLMQDLNYLEVSDDEKGNPNIFLLRNEKFYKGALDFLNEQRRLDDKKRVIIPPRSEAFMEKIIEQLEGVEPDGDGKCEVNLSKIIEEFKSKNISVGQEDFLDVISQGLAEEIVVASNNEYVSLVKIEDLKVLFPFIRFINKINRLNEEKATKA
ncbi:cyclic nucleotide-binding domain-containing protein [Bacteriovoracales bacterium]|nr:cyclic nucleotide-binding domain-containing protein [Bacteriovoracales bacterium]